MKKRHYKYGRHPMVLFNHQRMRNIERSLKEIDPLVRIVPTRFGSIKSKNSLLKTKINPRNSKELYLEFRESGLFQRFKLECFSEEHALLIQRHFDMEGN